MCGRFSLTVQEDEIERFFDVTVDRRMYVPRYNGAPSQSMAIITGEEGRMFRMMRWGLVPSWAKDLRIGNKMINARAETILDKPAFRQAFRSRRCLVPADGFYEWKQNGKKVPYRITMKNQQLFAMAGIWELWRDPEGKQTATFCILTTTPNLLMANLHDRMPVILPPDYFDEYLFSDNPNDLQGKLLPFPADELSCYRVSDLVNSPRNDDARLIQAFEASSPGLF